ncbi:adhesin [Actinoplanes couchii]|uniref:Uncharacterized protein n=1 Tax=Actinoplanes couchii TaxID=403638 RepID=A0ABQ3XAP4_9ACTN|nr:adhesin [Actinoplanes couchii]MDR6324833.1 hypothetical protein [Actinoplanes couchii]GID55546.1 hypothetical protein Aco03nite_039500 [Actinoplanes couchii]
MRATVGPLPSAVYWRRRLVVLGAVLLGVIVLFVSCSGGDDPDPKKTAGQDSPYPTPAAGDPSAASPTPSFEASAPGVGPALPDPADLLSQKPDDEELPPPANASAPVGGTGTNPGTNTGTTCADTEIQLTPVPDDTSPQKGAPTDIQIKIKNVGGRACSRDLGSSAQELYIEQGAQKFWSSDQCTTAADNDVVSLAAGAEKIFKITWNGRSSTQCADNAPSGPSLATGPYALRARLDTKVSDPVVLTVVN